MPTLDELFEYYRNTCLPAYADAVTHFGKKPQQILVEFENALGHIAQCYNPTVDPDTRVTNVSKAKDHLIRVTLDSYKMVWIRLNNEIDNVAYDQRKRLFCVNMTQEEFTAQYNEFKRLAEEARRLELQCVGVDPLNALEPFISKAQLRMHHDKHHTAIMVLCPPFYQEWIGYRAYNQAYYQITKN